MADLQNSINPTNTPETVVPTPISGNNTGIDLSSTLEPNNVAPSTWTVSQVQSTPTQINNVSNVAPQPTPNIPSNIVGNPNLESNKPNQIDANKAKLMEALKAEWKKGKRTWFTRWILSWVLITLLIAVAGIIFTKDQVINILSDERLDFLDLKASVVSLTDNQNTNSNTNVSNEEAVVEEEVTPEEAVVEEEAAPEDAVVEEEVAPEEAVVEEEATPEETVVEEEATPEEAVVEEEATPEEAVVEEEATPEEAVVEEEVAPEDAVVEEEATPEEAVVEEESASDKWYTFRHVNSPEEANWVLSPNCEDTLCGNDKDSIVLCNEFRLHESLSDDAKRTGNSWICRYKDVSELVFIEFN